MSEARRVTLKDIAESLGFSVNTVSRALTGKDSVSDATRQRVRDEADRLGYVPNSMARSLVLGSAMTLGLVITNPSNPFYARLISAIEQRGRVHGYSLMLLVTEESVDGDRAAAEALLRWGVDGALVVPVRGEAEHWQRLSTAGIPLVFLNRDVPALDIDFVGVDYEDGAYAAADHVLGGSTGTLRVLEEDLPITPVADRLDGFRRAMADAGRELAEDTVVSVPTRRAESSALPWDPSDSYLLAQQIISGTDRPEAILVGNDYFALGVYRAVTEAGLRIPEDVRVCGYGDHPFSAYLNPALTTVRLPAAEIGTAAVDLLLGKLKGDAESAPEKVKLRPELIARDSSDGRKAG